MQKFRYLSAAIIMVCVSLNARSDMDAGRQKAAACAGCHGESGISSNPLFPNLAGQKAGYIARQLLAFRDGRRSDAMMGPLTQSLSDRDIENLAAWYSSLNPGPVTAPCGE